MTSDEAESQLASALKAAAGVEPVTSDRALRNAFVARLRETASHPDVVPIEFNGRRIDVPRGGTILGAALKNGFRVMHVCGGRKLCATCRVKVEVGEENLTPMESAERFSLRWHLSASPRTRLACQARVEGPVEVESVFPLCGNLPGK
jgi:ferredoxin